MRSTILSLILAMSMLQETAYYRVTDQHEVVSEHYDYLFRWPDKWSISSASRVPYLFTFATSYLESSGVRVGVPRGGAEISIVADEESHQAGSVDRWIEMDRGADGFSSTHELRLSSATTISHAIQVVSFHDDGDSSHKQITRTTAIYFEFQKHILAAYLSYNANDPKAREYEGTLIAVIQSFRPLNGANSPK